MPRSIMLQYSVQYGQQFAHTGGNSCFLGFTSQAQTLVEALDYSVVSCRHQSGHIKRWSYLRSATPDSPFTAKLAPIMVEGCHTHESSNLFTVQRSQFRKLL